MGTWENVKWQRVEGERTLKSPREEKAVICTMVEVVQVEWSGQTLDGFGGCRIHTTCLWIVCGEAKKRKHQSYACPMVDWGKHWLVWWCVGLESFNSIWNRFSLVNSYKTSKLKLRKGNVIYWFGFQGQFQSWRKKHVDTVNLWRVVTVCGW